MPPIHSAGIDSDRRVICPWLHQASVVQDSETTFKKAFEGEWLSLLRGHSRCHQSCLVCSTKSSMHPDVAKHRRPRRHTISHALSKSIESSVCLEINQNETARSSNMNRICNEASCKAIDKVERPRYSEEATMTEAKTPLRTKTLDLDRGLPGPVQVPSSEIALQTLSLSEHRKSGRQRQARNSQESSSSGSRPCHLRSRSEDLAPKADDESPATVSLLSQRSLPSLKSRRRSTSDCHNVPQETVTIHPRTDTISYVSRTYCLCSSRKYVNGQAPLRESTMSHGRKRAASLPPLPSTSSVCHDCKPQPGHYAAAHGPHNENLNLKHEAEEYMSCSVQDFVSEDDRVSDRNGVAGQEVFGAKDTVDRKRGIDTTIVAHILRREADSVHDSGVAAPQSMKSEDAGLALYREALHDLCTSLRRDIGTCIGTTTKHVRCKIKPRILKRVPRILDAMAAMDLTNFRMVQMQLDELAQNLTCHIHVKSQATSILAGWRSIILKDIDPASVISEALLQSTGLSLGKTEPRTALQLSGTQSFSFCYDFSNLSSHSNPRLKLRKLVPYGTEGRYLPAATHLRRKINSKVGPGERSLGTVYIYSVPNSFGQVKIGYTSVNAKFRVDAWEKKCGHPTMLQYPLTETDKILVPHAHRVEKLVHIDLKKYRRKELGCETCGGCHDEWFEIPLPDAIATVRKWSAWMRRIPYEETLFTRSNGRTQNLTETSQWTLKEGYLDSLPALYPDLSIAPSLSPPDAHLRPGMARPYSDPGRSPPRTRQRSRLSPSRSASRRTRADPSTDERRPSYSFSESFLQLPVPKSDFSSSTESIPPQ